MPLTCEHKHLGPVVLDVIRVVCQLLGALHCSHEGLGVSGTSPVGIGLPLKHLE